MKFTPELIDLDNFMLELPEKSVLDSLIKLQAETKETVQSLNGELGSRIQNQGQQYGEFQQFWQIFSKLTYKFQTNEQAATALARINAAANLYFLEWAKEHGHAGDLAEMAKAAAEPPKAKTLAERRAETAPLDEMIAHAEESAPGSNVVAMEQPKRRPGRPRKEKPADGDEKTTSQAMAEANAAGDAMIRGEEPVQRAAGGKYRELD